MKYLSLILLLLTLNVNSQTIPFDHLVTDGNGKSLTYNMEKTDYRVVSFGQSFPANYALRFEFKNYNSYSWSNIMTFLQENVGIGTTTPTERLTVNGNIFATGTGNVFANKIGIGTTNPSESLTVYGNIQATNGGGIGTGNEGRVYANRIGIGTTSPAENLTVVGNVLATGAGNQGRVFANRIGIGTTSPAENLTVVGNILAAGSGEMLANKVGIGTTNPNDHLHILGGLTLQGNGGTAPPSQMWRVYHNANASNDYGLQFMYNGNLRIRFLENEFKFDGLIKSTEIKVQANVWADFVFEEGYELPSLEEVEAYINQNGHLKDIPSEKEVKENGINLGKMNARLLQKIEELTLYIIDQEKRMKQHEEKILELERKFNN